MISDEQRHRAVQTLSAYLTSRGLRKTPERFAILDKIWELPAHFDIHALQAAMEDTSYHVSLSTIYNTVNLFNSCGILRRHTFGREGARFEVAVGGHIHLICSSCGKIQETPDAEVAERLIAKSDHGFTPSYFSVCIYGLCASCHRRSKRKKRNADRQNTKTNQSQKNNG